MALRDTAQAYYQGPPATAGGTDRYGDSLGGKPLTIITLFSDTPRALAATPDGSRVYAAAHASGNRTTTGLIVKYKDGRWQDEIGRKRRRVTDANTSTRRRTRVWTRVRRHVSVNDPHSSRVPDVPS